MQIIDLDFDKSDLTNWLGEKGWIVSGDSIQKIEKPGEGNMNVVLRLIMNSGSLILKQSRPYVNKYQDIPAPIERIDVEYQFYKNIEGAAVNDLVPEILAYDKDNYLLLMQDLGDGSDLTALYDQRKVAPEMIQSLLEFIQKVHTQKVDRYSKNLSLRKLNHQHIFVLPFMEDNGFQLDDIQFGLQELSLSYKTDTTLKSTIQDLGEQYLSDGDTLLHGDYYPGSWIHSEGRLYVIDPEFSFLGFPEFDLGVMAAHLVMITGDVSQVENMLRSYGNPIREKLVQQIAGTEIMRRLIGLAQLPLKRSLEEKAALLEMAKKMILI